MILNRAGYSGIWLCEYYNQFFTPFNSDIRQKVLEAVRETAAAQRSMKPQAGRITE